jgi:hypothetical protein
MTTENPPVTPAPAPAPEPTPAPAPAPAPAPEPKTDGETDEVKALKAQLAAAQTKAADLEKAQSDAEEAERQKNLTAEQKATELEAKLKETERTALVEKVRRVHGYGDKAFDVVATKGATEDEIKAEYETHKTALDEYVKAQGGKPGQGGGTGGGAKPTGESNQNDKKVPYLVAKGIVKPKQAV